MAGLTPEPAPAPARPRPVSIRLRYAVCSSGGRRSNGARKVNQDAHGILPRLCGLSYVHAFFVADGHGKIGEQVSGLVRTRLQAVLEDHLSRLSRDSLLYNPSRKLNTRDVRDQIPPLAQALQAACQQLQREARAAMDTSLSGTTLVLALLVGAHGVFANVGDSRCVLGYLPSRRERESTKEATPTERQGADTPDSPSVEASAQSVNRGRGARIAVDAAANARPPPPDRELEARVPPPGASVADSTESPVAGPFKRRLRSEMEEEEEKDEDEEGHQGPSTATMAARLERQADAVTPASLLASRAITIDQTPVTASERPRIESCGGVVQPHFSEATKQFVGPPRVWSLRFPGYPGLAMGRSIGDDVATQCGVICDPVISYQHLRPSRDMWLVLASDGVWEVMENADAISLVQDAATIEDAAIHVCQEANTRWERSCALRGSLMIDDITAVAIHLWPDRSSASLVQAAASRRRTLLEQAKTLRHTLMTSAAVYNGGGSGGGGRDGAPFGSRPTSEQASGISSSGTQSTLPASAVAGEDSIGSPAQGRGGDILLPVASVVPPSEPPRPAQGHIEEQ